MKHILKTDPNVFVDVVEGTKTFEIRKDDRNFKVGDLILLRQTRYTCEEMENGKPLEYTGQEARFTISYILHGPIYGLVDGWAIMSILSNAKGDIYGNFKSS